MMGSRVGVEKNGAKCNRFGCVTEIYHFMTTHCKGQIWHAFLHDGKESPSVEEH